MRHVTTYEVSRTRGLTDSSHVVSLSRTVPMLLGSKKASTRFSGRCPIKYVATWHVPDIPQLGTARHVMTQSRGRHRTILAGVGVGDQWAARHEKKN